MEFYIIRHGQSTNNALPDHQGRVADSPLTELGRRQAEAVARFLANGTNMDPIITNPETGKTELQPQRGQRITKLLCSPMHRSLQTAAPIATAVGVRPEVWVDIHEHGGIYLEHDDGRGIVGYSGMTRGQILAEFPDYVLPEQINDEGWWHGGQESLAECEQRALRVAAQLQEWAAGQYADERVAIITHGTFSDRLLKTLMSLSPGNHHYFWHYNTAISRLDFVHQGLVVVRYVNRVDHLTPELIS